MGTLPKSGLKFGQRYSVREKLKPVEFARGIWSPKMLEWRDVVEDYLHISTKRIANKWAMFKLQLNIFQDIVSNIQTVDQYMTPAVNSRHETSPHAAARPA